MNAQTAIYVPHPLHAPDRKRTAKRIAIPMF